MAKNNNLLDFLADMADTIRETEHPYIEHEMEGTPDSFADHTPQNVNNVPVYGGNWELGGYNCTTDEYLVYNTYEPGGDWVCRNGNVWGSFSGFGASSGHDNYLDFGGNVDATHSPCICFKAPKKGRVRLSCTRLENTDGWRVRVYVNAWCIFDFDATGMSLAAVNATLRGVSVPVEAGDAIRFVAVRMGNNWHCKMVPAVQYEMAETINPQDFSGRIEGLPDLVRANIEPPTGNKLYAAMWRVKDGIVETAPYYYDLPANLSSDKQYIFSVKGSGYTIELHLGSIKHILGKGYSGTIYTNYQLSLDLVVNTPEYNGSGTGKIVLLCGEFSG